MNVWLVCWHYIFLDPAVTTKARRLSLCCIWYILPRRNSGWSTFVVMYYSSIEQWTTALIIVMIHKDHGRRAQRTRFGLWWFLLCTVQQVVARWQSVYRVFTAAKSMSRVAQRALPAARDTRSCFKHVLQRCGQVSRLALSPPSPGPWSELALVPKSVNVNGRAVEVTVISGTWGASCLPVPLCVHTWGFVRWLVGSTLLQVGNSTQTLTSVLRWMGFSVEMHPRFNDDIFNWDKNTQTVKKERQLIALTKIQFVCKLVL